MGGGQQDTKHINDAMNESVAKKEEIPDKNTAEVKLKVNSFTSYVEAEAFVGNPYSLLGRVLEVRKQNGKIPSTLDDPDFSPEFTLFPIAGVKVDESSKIQKPIQRSSIIVNKSISAQVRFLSYLSAELSEKTTFSLMVFDQTMGLVDVNHESWPKGVIEWKERNQDLLEDPEIAYLYTIIGFVQKNVIRKKYEEFDVGAKGGAYGVNVEGKLHTSTEEYSLDIRFGLTPAVIKRPTATKQQNMQTVLFKPTPEEIELFASISKVNSSSYIPSLMS